MPCLNTARPPPNEIFPFALPVVNNMCHQSQIPFNEHLPGLRVPLGILFQPLPLLSGGQGLGEGPAAGEAQGKQQRIGEQQQRGGQHKTSLPEPEAPAAAFPAGGGPNLGAGCPPSPLNL